MPESVIFFAIAVAYLIGQRIVRTRVARRWMEGRISNAGCVLILVLSSGTGLGLILVAGTLLLHPSTGGLIGLVVMAFTLAVVFGFGMTAITYASSHGVREHWRQQIDRPKRDR